MEEQILKMISEGPDNGNECLANAITSHVMDFIKWLRFNCRLNNKGDYGNVWWLKGKYNTGLFKDVYFDDNAIYKYWLSNIKA